MIMKLTVNERKQTITEYCTLSFKGFAVDIEEAEFTGSDSYNAYISVYGTVILAGATLMCGDKRMNCPQRLNMIVDTTIVMRIPNSYINNTEEWFDKLPESYIEQAVIDKFSQLENKQFKGNLFVDGKDSIVYNNNGIYLTDKSANAISF